jgi:cation transport regulator ChaC
MLGDWPSMWIFGYGSLVGSGGRPARLRGFRRCWDVAMDNRRRIPGYKVFVDPESNEAPPVFVTFLNIRRDGGASVNGVLFPATDAELEALDARERNYRRVDVTRFVEAGDDAPTWAYVGTGEARGRYERGRASGTAVVSADYLAGVERDFASFGEGMLEAFRDTTDPPEVPIAPLSRVDLPALYLSPQANGRHPDSRSP